MINSNVLASTDINNLTAVILAGGLGTRLRSVVADRPKVLAEVRNRPFLAYLLDRIAAIGILNVVLCTGYLGEQIEATFGNSYGNLRLLYSQESSPLGTGGALRLALPLLQSESVLVMNGDSLGDANLKEFWQWHSLKNAMASLLLAHVDDTKRYGKVEVDSQGKILSFSEKEASSGGGWINAGIYVFNRQILSTIPVNQPVSLEQEMFPIWINQGFYGYLNQGRFLDIGTPESYRMAEQFLAMEKGE